MGFWLPFRVVLPWWLLFLLLLFPWRLRRLGVRIVGYVSMLRGSMVVTFSVLFIGGEASAFVRIVSFVCRRGLVVTVLC